jgi:hypothetical protein
MNKLILLLIVGLTFPLRAVTLQEQYQQYGQIIFTQLPSAPFPHPARAEGKTRDGKVYPADKHYSDNHVAIFIPKGFRPGNKVDFVVHFHGWYNHVENVLKKYDLLKQFSESGRNAILVVPQGPYDAPDSFDGKLEDEGGFKRFMDDVMSTLRKQEVIQTQPVGKIILSGHSGGYQVISSIVTVGGLTEHIQEVWLFDALYAQTDKFMAWYQKGHGRMINIYTENGGTKKETEDLIYRVSLQKMPMPFFSKKESETTEHDLRSNRLIFIFTEAKHDEVLNKPHQFHTYLKTSRLAAIKQVVSPKALTQQ